jgi:hypothetical protein
MLWGRAREMADSSAELSSEREPGSADRGAVDAPAPPPSSR